MAHFHDSQCTHDLQPHSSQPRRRSYSAINNTNRAVAAAMLPASSQISASNRSVGFSSVAIFIGLPFDNFHCSWRWEHMFDSRAIWL